MGEAGGASNEQSIDCSSEKDPDEIDERELVNVGRSESLGENTSESASDQPGVLLDSDGSGLP